VFLVMIASAKALDERIRLLDREIANIVLLFAAAVPRMSTGAARALFLVFAIVTGASLASLFAAYTAASIVGTFVAAAAGYAVLALAGFATTRDLSGLGKFMTVALVGLIVALLINLFIRSSGADFLLSCVGVVIFGALVAVDSQRVKAIYESDDSGATAGQLAILGALTLYLDFLNLFLSLIRLTGRRRS
jgi:FtsH-binding integral membrane protein